MFTGTDYTAAFFNKGKVKALKLMLEGDEADGYVNSFQALSHGQEYNMENFVCNLYGIRGTEHVDAARTAKLFALAGVKKKSGLKTPEMKSKLKKVNCSLLPPCSKVLNMKMKRALYLSSIWTKASGNEPSQGLSPVDYGWEKVVTNLVSWISAAREIEWRRF